MDTASKIVGALGVGLALVLASPVLAAEEPLEPRALFLAVRARGELVTDGRLDEPAWAEAPVLSAFTQSFPVPGAAPSEKTEVRLLYDDANLYVGITAFDSQPEAIHQGLGRRDAIPASDVVRVMIDSLRDRTTGYVFSINAGGTLEDGRLTDDLTLSTDWDGMWEGSAVVTNVGWTAEMRLPLRMLRFPTASEQRWGFHVRREIARTQEQLDSVVIPREANALVSRFGDLRGLRDIQHRSQLTLLPYVASRLTAQSFAPGGGARRLVPSVDVGLDLQANLTSDLTLTATVNPDFGQVEADRLLVNLGTAEVFFPEKRPFFLEGVELFLPVGAENGRAAQTLFYSRRIGLETPVLGAAKLTGTVREGLQVSLLDAVVMGAVNPHPDREPPDGRYQFHPRRPFHFAPNSSLPTAVQSPTNYLAGVMRAELAPGVRTGAMITSVNPLTQDCCETKGGQGAAVDFSLRNPDGAYVLLGQVDGSRVTGLVPEGVRLRDGTLLRSGDVGFGTYLKGGKLGGQPWRTTLTYQLATPRLDLSPAGFQPVQNEQDASAHIQYGYSDGWGPFAELWLGIKGHSRWSADGRGLGLYKSAMLTIDATFPDSSNFWCESGADGRRQDLREIDGYGVAFERPTFLYVICGAVTNRARPLSFSAVGYVDRTFNQGATLGQVGSSLELGVTWRPLPRFQTQFQAGHEATQDGPRWVEALGPDRHLFAQLTPRFLSFTLRQLVVITPRLTLQAYAQLLSGYGHYGPFFLGVAPPRGFLRLSDLVPTDTQTDPSFHSSALNLNLVARWEYRLGSTLFLVYSRAQEEPSELEGAVASRSLLPRALLSGPGTDTLLLKANIAW
ncbi:carbohydrate binding family 9 domain-containing protein [Archangium primigenium]|uniref:carbohydrate binding family 9 domain-containing protein n=1 Tax=[Archangium] primigenium TaxID=2792470 RepID=UPI00195DCC34|nr:carbohydrate binding family 9 domain-containing protein [Archangium primigenium]MBM7114475.1 carbohydrate binding family 9 domain-containing protein [Archangium primigenium]